MTFGSFIGFSGAFPKLIVDIFQNYPDVECAEKMALDETMKDCKNPDAPQTYNFAFLGALIGSLIRPLGGTLSDKIGGARVTHYHAIIMTRAAPSATATTSSRASSSASSRSSTARASATAR